MNKYILLGVVSSVAFIIGSTKGDDLLEYFTEDKESEAPGISEEIGKPLNADEVKELGLSVFELRGYDVAGIDDLKGLTTDHGYVVTGLSGGQFVAQCFIEKDLVTVICTIEQ